MADDSPLMTPAEVARLFNVDEKTVARWAVTGLLGDAVLRLPSGHRRFRRDKIMAIYTREA